MIREENSMISDNKVTKLKESIKILTLKMQD